MEPTDKDENIELPEDSGNDSGHSAGYYEAHEKQEEHKEDVPTDSVINAEPETDAKNSENDAEIKRIVKRKSLIAFTVFGMAFLLFIGGYIWIIKSPVDNGASRPLRSVLSFNEGVNKQFFKNSHLAPEYPKSMAEMKPRVNGDYGMDPTFDTAEWSLFVVNIDSKDTLQLDMNDIKKLPKTEIVFNFKCIEGWSQITHWGGVRLIDFIKFYKLATHSGKPIDENHLDDLAHYAGFMTPDEQYYVGLDIASALHPQTLLCYEMNGKPLPYDQGAPLRLIVPVKYGVKSIKRIGTIYFSDKRPKDYWYEQGYDYDASL